MRSRGGYGGIGANGINTAAGSKYAACTVLLIGVVK
jgi:hypothetical protein